MEEPVALLPLVPPTEGHGAPDTTPATGSALLPGRRRRRLPTPVAVIFWCIVVPLAVVAVMRIVAWDAFEPFAVLNDVTVLVYLPAWLIATAAAVGRRWILCGAAVLVVVAQVAFMAPELTASGPVPTWAVGAPSLTLFDANVYNHNPSMAGYISALGAVRPALVTLEEATPPDVSALDASGVLAALPYRLQIRQFDPWSFLIASKYPIVNANAVYAYGRPLILQATLNLPTGPSDLWVVHTVAPLPSSYSQWVGQLDVINRAVRRHGSNRLLVVGDFNATWGSKGFRQVLDAGLTDAAAARGQPFAMTWPNDLAVLPPMVRIDHILTGGGLAVTRFASAPGQGSDHGAMVATIATESLPVGGG